MQAKEAASLVNELLRLDNHTTEQTEELLIGAELLARHVLAAEADPELMMGVPISHLEEMKQQQSRYLLILEKVNAADDAARMMLENQLDREIALREELRQ